MPKWSRVQVEDYYYSLYLLLLDDARQNFSKIGRNMTINDKSAAKLYRWAVNEKVLLPPFLRLNVHPNCLEYTYFLRFRNPLPIFEKLQDDSRVVYESICSGAFDLMVIATEKIDFSMERSFEGYVLSGPRSDFMYNRVERRSEREYFKEFYDFLAAGDFVESEIKISMREEFTWDELDYGLFHLLKNDFRTKYIDIIRCFGLSKSVFYDHLHNVVQRCTLWTPYYPDGYSNYNEFFILFKTAYEHQLVEQLKGIPVHCPMLKISDIVFSHVLVEKDLQQVKLLNLLTSMQSSGFIEEYTLSIPIYHWEPNWTIQDFHHHSRLHSE
ncbi:MAG: hypothetical protein WBA22_02225 [Candidatus Methanofastidiosia archaeon]